MSRYEYHRRNDTRRLMRFEAQRKSALLAYILWFFLGTFGVHRFYLGHVFSGFVMLGLTAIGALTSWILVGFLPMALVGLWWLLDAILTYVMTENYNSRLAYELS